MCHNNCYDTFLLGFKLPVIIKPHPLAQPLLLQLLIIRMDLLQLHVS
jgi:hypothetical protein